MCSPELFVGEASVSARTNRKRKLVHGNAEGRASIASEDDKGKRNRRFVVGTFFSSLLLLIFATAYEMVCRPLLRPLIGKLLENLTMDLADGKTPLFVLVSELVILLPLLLSLLPITQWWRKTFVAKKEDENNKEGIKVGALLFIIAWSLWIVALVSLVVGIVLGPGRVGVISISALLAFFAQSVANVGCLLLNASSIEDDEMRREAQSIGETLNIESMKASEWLRLQKGTNGSSASSRHKNNHSSAPKRSSTLVDWFMKGKNREFLLFFAMKIFLLQSPYAFQYGLHLLHACANCVGLEFHEEIQQSSGEKGLIVPKEFTGLVTFCCTLLVPLFSHGVGGVLFHNEQWTFHHPLGGGRSHVRFQATGWSLIGVAGLLHLVFLMIGSGQEHLFLLHSGSAISTIAEVLLLYSLMNFLPDQTASKNKSSSSDLRVSTKSQKTQIDGLKTTWTTRKVCWLLLSYIQDLLVTNLHWVSPIWLVLAMLGIDTFHPFEASTIWGIVANVAFVASVCAMPTLLIPYSPRRKEWRWNFFGLINEVFINFMFHPEGLFNGTELRFEEESVDAYKGEKGIMFAITPHGILPTSVIALWHQYQDIFRDVCVFFGSQVSLVPNYRFLLGMQGGYLPVEKSRLVEVMQTNQNVALVPGGVAEMLSCIPHDPTINVSVKHKGFIRLALQQGYDLVPTVFFHSSDQYNNPGRILQLWTYRKTGIPVGIPIYCNWLFLPFSNRTPIKVALGKRIVVEKRVAPTEDEVNELHYKFYAEVFRVWDKYADEFSYGDRELAYVQ